MPRLELIFLHSANEAGCFRWRDEDRAYLQSEHDPLVAFNDLVRIGVTLAPLHIGRDER
jgi:hypothetical protein